MLFRNLVDTTQRGKLTFPEFAMGMHLIDALKSCRLGSVPTSLPPVLFEQFENFEPPVPKEQPRSPFMSPEEGASSSSGSRSAPPSKKSPAVPPKPPPPVKPRSLSKPWTITPTQKTDYDAEFAQLDAEGTGLVPEEDALRFLRKYHLPVEELAHIWYAFISLAKFLSSLRRYYFPGISPLFAMTST